MVSDAVNDGFVHLRVRSAYSLLEGAIKADKVSGLAKAAEMPAVALTDRANLYGALEFSVTSKDAGVQPIIGCALPVTGIGGGQTERWAKIPTIVLLAQSEQGYLNLSELSSLCYLEADGSEDVRGLQQVVRRTMGRWVSNTYRRRPMILPVVVAA